MPSRGLIKNVGFEIAIQLDGIVRSSFPELTIKLFHNYVFHEPSKMLPHQRLDNLSI